VPARSPVVFDLKLLYVPGSLRCTNVPCPVSRIRRSWRLLQLSTLDESGNDQRCWIESWKKPLSAKVCFVKHETVFCCCGAQGEI